MFLHRRHLVAMYVAGSLLVFTVSAADAAEYLVQVPDTEMCGVMKNDIEPNMESRQNREDIEHMFRGTMLEGRQGQQCNIFRSRRSQLRGNSALNLTGTAAYHRERVFAVGRLCLLDWCDMSPGGRTEPSPDPDTVTPSRERDAGRTPPERTPPSGTIPPRIATPTPSPTPDRDNGTYTLRICNRSSLPVIAAAVALYDDPSDDSPTIRGWENIRIGECASWSRRLGKYGSHTVAYHVRGGTRVGLRAGEGDVSYCIKKAEFIRRHTAGYRCRSDETLVGFRFIKVVRGDNVVNVGNN